jgi:hypothetical protein
MKGLPNDRSGPSARLCKVRSLRIVVIGASRSIDQNWAHSRLAMVQRSILFRWHLNVSFQRYGTTRMQVQPMSAIPPIVLKKSNRRKSSENPGTLFS